jgi:L-rhamnose mutarotase
MFLKPGYEAEYERRHREIWPELQELLRGAGVRNYSIFLDRSTGTLFAYQEVEGEQGSQDLGSTEIVQRWWAYMADIMETNPDHSPVSVPLDDVFYMP